MIKGPEMLDEEYFSPLLGSLQQQGIHIHIHVCINKPAGSECGTRLNTEATKGFGIVSGDLKNQLSIWSKVGLLPSKTGTSCEPDWPNL